MEKKVAIVTGGSKGIGEAIARRLVKDGFSVAIAARGFDAASALAEELGSAAKAYKADVSIKADVDGLVSDVVRDFGRLDVMVNNAGISIETSLMDLSEEDFDKLVGVNIKGVLFGIQAAARQFMAQGSSGKIINASSIGGYKVSPGHSGYSATKFAVRSLTQAAARELGKYNITTNCYCPGYVMTPMMEDIIKNLSAKMNITSEQLVQSKSTDVALGRPAYPDDIAGVVSFLAGPDSDYINGQAIIVDGGNIYK